MHSVLMTTAWVDDDSDWGEANVLLAQALIDRWDDPQVVALREHTEDDDHIVMAESLVEHLVSLPAPVPTGAAWDLHERAGIGSRLGDLASQLYSLVFRLAGFGGPDGLDHDRPLGTHPEPQESRDWPADDEPF